MSGCGGGPLLTDTKMQLTSPAFAHNANIPAQYTCDGYDVNPTLDIADVPDGTQSLALIMDDPDAPRGTWVHWLVWNIDPSTTKLAENTVPAKAVEGMTSFGKPGYGGPCPPSGTHRYFFKLYALDTTLDLHFSADKAALEAAMNGHVLTQAELIGLYARAR
ncbi:MAG: hypothetical protein A2788_01285 [Candidatus Abawacabacteria bacterium RIFCSPHIGHO2_01_FULL_46_8]|uniref:Kinase inhibitor n=1 Tax=Candidatus Abawacabacteria bacterium RIFCSPHIGHO2_01_FULL_46_8 TaxID=1817815 RepID=A0A1F4XJK2_9BACT|nr:MAG: hypothetical protein A2788_01285 [Candidatus Abawacabacteria bacterium RIFCSPHIGHO2_01_FULL_46_8]